MDAYSESLKGACLLRFFTRIPRAAGILAMDLIEEIKLRILNSYSVKNLRNHRRLEQKCCPTS